MSAVLEYLIPVGKAALQGLLVGGSDYIREKFSLGLVLLLLLAVIGLRFGNLWLLQRNVNDSASRLEPGGQPTTGWLWRELRYSTLAQLLVAGVAIALLPLTLLFLAGRLLWWLFRKVRAWWRKRQAVKAGLPPPVDEDGDTGPVSRAGGVLVSAVAPSLLDGAAIAWVMWLLSIGADWLLATKYGLGTGAGGLAYLFLGTQPWLAWLWPLERDPVVNLAVSGLVWTTVWWWSARTVRLFASSELGRNLYENDDPDVPTTRWARWYGARARWLPHTTFGKWARVLLLATLPLLLLAAMSLEPAPYAVPPAAFVLALVTWFSLLLWLYLPGLFRPLGSSEAPPLRVERGAGWLNVRADLEARLRVTFPPEAVGMAARTVARLRLKKEAPAFDVWLKRELLERLPESAGDIGDESLGLTQLQDHLLAFLQDCRPSGLRMRAPASSTLSLQTAAPVRNLGLELRPLCLMAPAGAGKTTAGVLAACDMAVVEARSTLVIVRDDADAHRWRDRFENVVSGTSVRFAVSLLELGVDAPGGHGAVPDVVVVSLKDLMTRVLGGDFRNDHPALLSRIGMVIVDDLESFSGPSEQHLQLSLRRLRLVLQEAGAMQAAHESTSNLLLVGLMQESSLNMQGWVNSVLSHAEVEVVRFDAGGPGTTQASPPQVLVLLPQVRQPDGKGIAWQDVVDSCERLGVPWSFIHAGDEYRRLSSQVPPLPVTPVHFKTQPLECAVVFVSGTWSAVNRENALLTAAGRRFSCVRAAQGAGPLETIFPGQDDKELLAANTVAVLSLVDGDELMAFTELDRQSDLATALDTLPRPLPHPPEGDIAQAHLVAELVHGLEVGQAIDLVGPAASTVLVDIVRSQSAAAQPYRDVREQSPDHEALVRIRLLQGAIPTEAKLLAAEERNVKDLERLEARRASLLTTAGVTPRGDRHDQARLLREIDHALGQLRKKQRHPLDIPMPPQDPELGALGATRYKDLAANQVVLSADRHSAFFTYYPGRVVLLKAGRYTIDDHQVRGPSPQGTLRPGDQTVSPCSDAVESTPRRLVWCEFDARENGRAWYRRREAWGRYPVDITRGFGRLSVRHVATILYEPQHGVVRRRTVLTQAEQETYERDSLRDARVLQVHASSWRAGAEAPRLTLGAARLVAAAIRMALPSMFRSFNQTCGVGLMVHSRVARFQESPDLELGPDDGILLFDLQEGAGNQIEALERHGLELLLRMARRVVERVLYHQRLLVRFDEWADEDEVLDMYLNEERLRQEEEEQAEIEMSADADDDLSDAERQARTAERMGAGRRGRDAAHRKEALAWLDGILLPEGWTPVADAARNYGSAEEPGEGDRFDLGRIWHSDTGSVANLVWSKHRFVLSPGVEAGMDVGFDGSTLAKAANWLSRPIDEEPEFASLHASLHSLASLDAERLLGPVGTCSRKGNDASVQVSQVSVTPDQMVQWLAPAAWSWRRMQPVAQFLRRTWQDDAMTAVRLPQVGSEERNLALRAGAIAGFVQAMVNDPTRATIDGIRAAPLQTIITRSGGALDKAVLFATMAWGAGLQAGVFVRTREDKRVTLEAMAGVAVCVAPSGEGDAQAARSWQFLESWRKHAGLDAPLPMWAIARGMTRLGTAEVHSRVFVPVDVTADLAPGVVVVGDPLNWEFVPFNLILKYFEVPGHLRVPVPITPLVVDPNAPPLPEEDALERRQITAADILNPPALTDTSSKVKHLPVEIEEDIIRREWTFEDNNDGQSHTVSYQLSLAAVQADVGRHGVPTSFLTRTFSSSEDVAVLEARWLATLHERGLMVEGTLVRGDQVWMVERNPEVLTEVVAALRVAAGDKTDPRAWAGFVASFVQSLPYHIPRSEQIAPNFEFWEVMTPLETLARGWGDCDTKSVLFAALLLASGGPRSALVRVPKHMFAGAEVEPFDSDVSLTDGSVTYALVELTGSFALGEVASEYEDISGDGSLGEDLLPVRKP